MESYTVSIERAGRMLPVGTIRGNDDGSASFSYGESWLTDPAAAPVSVSLPLQEAPFTPEQTRYFFDGLLPEGFTRRSVAQYLHLDEGDYLSMLYGLGRECLGAIYISREGSLAEASYERVGPEQVQALAAEGATKSAELVTKAHLSLTGASGKVGLYYSADEDAWYLPKGTAPSTHIVKQSHIRFADIVANEQLCQMTAMACGIDIPHSFIINTGGGTDGEVLFATRRYDRSFDGASERINGLLRPVRLHQEDFAQALGIPGTFKYEKPGKREAQGYLERMFDLLRRRSADPIRDQIRLWDAIVYDYLIGNTDAHIKNFSLLYGPNLRTIRLAPIYDIVSTMVYEGGAREMAVAIDGVCDIREISRDTFRAQAGRLGLGERLAMARFDAMCARFGPALSEAAKTLMEAGYTRAGEIRERILEQGGYAHGA